MVPEARNGSLEATDEVTTDWLIETVQSELLRQEQLSVVNSFRLAACRR